MLTDSLFHINEGATLRGWEMVQWVSARCLSMGTEFRSLVPTLIAGSAVLVQSLSAGGVELSGLTELTGQSSQWVNDKFCEGTLSQK